MHTMFWGMLLELELHIEIYWQTTQVINSFVEHLINWKSYSRTLATMYFIIMVPTPTFLPAIVKIGAYKNNITRVM